jgi:hypothetical protein
MRDGWEVTYGFNPLWPTDADLDSETSGPVCLTNVMENFPHGPPADPVAISPAHFLSDGENGEHPEKTPVWLGGPKSATPLTRHHLKNPRKEDPCPAL